MDTVTYADPTTVTKTTSSSSSSGKGAALWIAIIALILAIVAVAMLVVYFIAYAVSGGTPGPRVTGCRYNVVQGTASGTTENFYAVGCSCYQALSTAGALTLTLTGPSQPIGQYFMIDNSSTPGLTITIVGGTGITVLGSNVISSGTVTTWYWRNNTTIVLVSTSTNQ